MTDLRLYSVGSNFETDTWHSVNIKKKTKRKKNGRIIEVPFPKHFFPLANV